MHHFPFLLSARGALGPRRFAVAIAVVYALGLAAQMLTTPPVLARLGLWPFFLMQIVLTWAWFALHAQRLRDAGRGIAAAQGIAVIHVLAVVLLVLVGAFFIENAAAEGWAPESVALIRQLVLFSRGVDPLTLLGLVACAALLIPPAFSVWAALQPGRGA
jgi:uncharacterized membrane protein YhaH (DUF805 family)